MFLNKWERPRRLWLMAVFLRLKNDRWAISSLLLVIILLIICFTAGYLAPFPDSFCGSFMSPPVWKHNGEITFLLGTDYLGRDIFSRLLLGFPSTFGIAILITLLVAIIGSLLTLINLYFTRAYLLIRIILNCLFIIPSLLLAISLILVLGNSSQNLILAITLSLLPYFTIGLTHLFKKELDKEYVIASQLDGASKHRILFEYILPNIVAQATYNLVRIFTFAILIITILNFLELGTSTDSNDWGTLMREYRTMVDINPWGLIAAGVMLSICILSVYLLHATLIRVFKVS